MLIRRIEDNEIWLRLDDENIRHERTGQHIRFSLQEMREGLEELL